MTNTGNLLRDVGAERGAERFDTLAAGRGARIERIVSTGQSSPPGFWYDQADDEWVAVIRGAARLRIEGRDDELAMHAGDWVHLPAGCRHRVEWTQADPPTVWLAAHFAR